MNSCIVCNQYYPECYVSKCHCCQNTFCDAECALLGVYCFYCGNFICRECAEKYRCVECNENYCASCTIHNELQTISYCKQCYELYY